MKAEGVRLAITPRPRGHDWLRDDLSILRSAGVDVVVSALTSEENEDLGLREEGRFCADTGLHFLSFPIEDRSVPVSCTEFVALLDSITDYLRKGNGVAVHCRAGIGRSSVIVASVLIRGGLTIDSAFRVIEEGRGCTVPDTPEQRQWVERNSVQFRSRTK
jgi:protein-tyrosine phosphatase